jgi:hypothetical protein
MSFGDCDGRPKIAARIQKRLEELRREVSPRVHRNDLLGRPGRLERDGPGRFGVVVVWPVVLRQLADGGGEGLVDRVRAVEGADGVALLDAVRVPRRDDGTALLRVFGAPVHVDRLDPSLPRIRRKNDAAGVQLLLRLGRGTLSPHPVEELGFQAAVFIA